MSLPERTLAAARYRGDWPLHQGQLTPNDSDWLLFAIVSQLVAKASLHAAFGMAQGVPRLKPGRPNECLFGRPPGGRLRLGRYRHPDAHAMTEQARQQARFEGEPDLWCVQLPQWLRGGVLKFRKDRWSYAPRLYPGSYRRTALALAEVAMQDLHNQQLFHQEQGPEEDPEGPLAQARAQAEQLLREARFAAEPFVDAHRLVLMLVDAGHLQEESRSNVCHYGCARVPRQQRARCLERRHLSWCNQRDNGYHRRQHDQGLDALPHRP